MTISAALSADLTTLTHALEDPESDIEALLEQLDEDARMTVASYVGLLFTIAIDGDPITLTTVHHLAQRDTIVSSVALRLNALRTSEPGTVLILYASTAGAFLDFAAELNQGFRLDPNDIALDQDLTRPIDESHPSGLRQRSILNQAIGVLCERGHTVDEARDELRRLARDSRTTVYEAAHQLIRAIHHRPTTRPPDSDSSGRRGPPGDQRL
jgi:ANTAR domain